MTENYQTNSCGMRWQGFCLGGDCKIKLSIQNNE